MIRKINNEIQRQRDNKKRLLQYAKRKHMVHYIYMINNVIERRNHYMSMNAGIDINGKTRYVYGINWMLSMPHSKESLENWFDNWVNSLKTTNTTFKDTLTKDI